MFLEPARKSSRFFVSAMGHSPCLHGILPNAYNRGMCLVALLVIVNENIYQ